MSLKSSNKTDTNVYTLEIEIGAEPFKAAVLKAYNKAKNKIALPGFRKGKAPLAMIERFYGKDVFYEDALEIAFPEAVSDAYKEAGIEPVDSPKDVNVKSIGEDGVLFEMKVTVKPEDIKVKAYKGLEAEKAEAAVTPEEVDARIEAMRERNARTITVEDRAAAKGDIAVIDFEGFVDGRAARVPTMSLSSVRVSSSPALRIRSSATTQARASTSTSSSPRSTLPSLQARMPLSRSLFTR